MFVVLDSRTYAARRPGRQRRKKRYVRFRAWWACNDVYRRDKDREFLLVPEQSANLERLLQLLDSNDPEDSLIIAELLRELGRFDECLQQLERHFDESLLLAVKAIQQLAKDRERRVAVIPG
jgi:hypothetical protein